MESFRAEDLGARESDWDGERGYKPIGGLRARHIYDFPFEDSNRGQSGLRRRFAQYELMSAEWLYIVDNDVPLTLSKNYNLWENVQEQPSLTQLCQDCRIFRLLTRPPRGEIQRLTFDLDELRVTTASCNLCRLILECLFPYVDENQGTIEVFRDCSVLSITEHGRPFLTILGDPG